MQTRVTSMIWPNPVSRCEESSTAVPVGNIGAIYVGYDHTERTGDACPVRSGPESCTNEDTEGDAILIVRCKTSVVCIGVGSRLLTNVLAEAWVRLQRCSRLTSPMTRLLMGIWQHRRPIMSRGGLCQAAPAALSTPRPGPYGRMACQPATA